MKVGIVVFPGSNCDRDCAHVLREVMGLHVEMIWHTSQDVGATDLVILPGGFSFGDYLRAGAIARTSPVMGAVAAFVRRGGAALGICNGFQILLEAGLLPGAMLPNAGRQFICQPARLRCVTTRTVFTRGLDLSAPLSMPIAHAQGRYFIDEVGLNELWEREQVVFQYVDAHGQPTQASNPNGSLDHIAGICDISGRVLGLMPHPERASEAIMGGEDGLRVFKSALEVLG